MIKLLKYEKKLSGNSSLSMYVNHPAVHLAKGYYLCNMQNGISNSIKRGTVIVLAALYLMFSVGILRATHFCMGRKASVTFFTVESQKCACSLFAGEKDSCCDDEHDLIRLENEQKTVASISLDLPQMVQLGDISASWLLQTTLAEITNPVVEQYLSPPPKVPLYKSQHRLIFYDDRLIG